MSDKNIQEYLRSLSHENLVKLKESVTIAGIMHSNGKPTKLYFKAKRDSSSGRLKKLYAALSKAEHKNLDNAFDAFVSLL
jgi:CRISPR/Cas system-associated endonuclease Cas3-HD